MRVLAKNLRKVSYAILNSDCRENAPGAPALPLVSVVIPAYNAEEFLAESVKSVLAQTHDKIEVIVVDDGSTDGTRGVMDRCACLDPRVRPIYREHKGATSTFAAGVELAQGEFIARMDADDLAMPERIAKQLAWMQTNAVDVCGSQVEMFGDPQPEWWFPETHADIRRELLFRCSMIFPTLLARASILKEYAFNSRTVFDDYELLTSLVVRHRLGNMQEKLVRYRRHANQMHILLAPEFRKDICRGRFRLFNALYPGTPLKEQAAFERLASRQTLRSVEEIRGAGRFMIQLAQADDPRLSALMRERWKKACERSKEQVPSAAEICAEFLALMESDSARETGPQSLTRHRDPEGFPACLRD